MKTLLIGINAKYIHTNNAIRLLKANCDFHVDLIEFTIKDDIQDIIRYIEEYNPDVLGFSCYIWNIDLIIKIINKLRLNGSKVILGGPEVSYESMYFKEKYSGFYMIASNCNEKHRQNKIKEKYDATNFSSNKEDNLKYISSLDEREFKVKEFKQGSFESFDVENCVQKADYHTYLDGVLDSDSVIEEYSEAAKALEAKKLDKTNKFFTANARF